MQLLRDTAATERVLYVSGEEGRHQVARRAERLDALDVPFWEGTLLEELIGVLEAERPSVLVVDSLQTFRAAELEGQPGGVKQAVAVADALTKYAHTHGVALWLVCHVRKDGELAGPHHIEHLVDVVCTFEALPVGGFRMIRVRKNRNGSTDEVALFEMAGAGLVPVLDPSRVLLQERRADLPGSALMVHLEGSRGLLVEAQALVTPVTYGTPQRTGQGLPRQRMLLLAAILDRRADLPTGTMDLFVNLAGGYEVRDPAGDLALVAAILSSAAQRPLPERAVFLGEVGLAGEVRQASMIERRLQEAVNAGMTQAFVARVPERVPDRLECIAVSTVGELRGVLALDL
jgi:DNA repair protein RadA/Sms